MKPFSPAYAARPAVLLLFILCFQLSHAQYMETTWKDTLWCPNDTFYMRFDQGTRRNPYPVGVDKPVSPGTDAYPGSYFTLYNGKDSMVVRYINRLPYAQVDYVWFRSPKGLTRYRFHFNERIAHFPDDYIRKFKSAVQFDLPEPYELANIIWTLSPSGQRAGDLRKDQPYYQEVLNYFKPWMNHPVFKKLDFPDSTYYYNYYNFRENSFAFNFRETLVSSTDTKLLFNGPYYYVYGDELADSSLFGKLLPLIEDFARVSGFRKFYSDHQSFYEKEIKQLRSRLPVRKMWDWLELQFPKSKFQSYRVVFSPLIGGSHSTQQYGTYSNNSWFQECVMFICGDRYPPSDHSISELTKEGFMSGIVFTEIDHNYVNPVSYRYSGKIDSAFGKRSFWAGPSPGTDSYKEPMSVFNEYMTHSAFCLYIADTYDPETAGLVIQRREDLMVDSRKFIHFKEFNQELMRLHKANKELKVIELFPVILDWCIREMQHEK
jgi:Domain of unknown function (DUF4932)